MHVVTFPEHFTHGDVHGTQIWLSVIWVSTGHYSLQSPSSRFFPVMHEVHVSTSLVHVAHPDLQASHSWVDVFFLKVSGHSARHSVPLKNISAPLKVSQDRQSVLVLAEHVAQGSEQVKQFVPSPHSFAAQLSLHVSLYK